MIIIVDELVHPALNVVSALDALAQCIDSFYIMSFSHYYLDTFICYSKMRPIHAPIMRQFICTKNKLKPFYTKKNKVHHNMGFMVVVAVVYEHRELYPPVSSACLALPPCAWQLVTYHRCSRQPL
jgi:hypothetical protein